MLNLCRDTRQQVRDAAITNIFRSISIPDYRPHLDGLMPLQSAVLEVVAALKLEVPGAASAVLKCKDVPSVYAPGAVDKMLAAYPHPMRLSHNCPAPGNFGSAEPLRKTATVNFLKVVRDVVPALRTFAQIVEGYRGALLAEFGIAFARSLDELHAEENFDLALLRASFRLVLKMARSHLLCRRSLARARRPPHIGHSLLVPDDLVRDLGKTLHLDSRPYELDLPIRFHKESRLAHQQSCSSLQQPVGADHAPLPTPPELRFDGDFDRQAEGAMHGTTVEVAEVGRERFAY
ncbi:hypothetical protein JCM5296_002332 [Sporobolomyces johnsonii]